MESTAWLRSPLVVVGLLVVFPPAGIFLMWRNVRWQRTTKVRLSYIAAAWFVAMLIIGSVKDHQRNPSNANDAQARRDHESKSTETKPDAPPVTSKRPTAQASTVPAPSVGCKTAC